MFSVRVWTSCLTESTFLALVLCRREGLCVHAEVTFQEVAFDPAHTWVFLPCGRLLAASRRWFTSRSIRQRPRTIKGAPAHQSHAGECRFLPFGERQRLDPMMKRLSVFI